MRALTLSMKEALFLTVLFIPVALKFWNITILGGLFVGFLTLLYIWNTFSLSMQKEALQREMSGIKVANLLTYDDYGFEKWVERYFLAKGFRTYHMPKGSDGGKDIILWDDANDKYYVEVKRYNGENTVGRPILQKLYGAMVADGVEYGYVVTTSTFTKEAVEWAKGVNIQLIDGKELEREKALR